MMPLTARCLCFIALMLMPFLFQAQTNHHSSNNKKELNMSTMEKNKQVIRNLYEQLFNDRRLELSKEIIDPEYPGTAGKKGPAAFDEGLAPLLRGLPDIRWTLHSLVAEDNTVISRWTWTGTLTNQFQFLEPTGKPITATGLTIYTLYNGKITKSEVLPDRLGFLQAMELVPTDLSTLTPNGSKDNVFFIDKFIVPASSRKEFYERMNYNRSFIKKMPGFIKDAAYEYTASDGNTICVSVAQWKNREAMNSAKTAIQEEFKKLGFDMPAFLQKMQITMDRGLYHKVN